MLISPCPIKLFGNVQKIINDQESIEAVVMKLRVS